MEQAEKDAVSPRTWYWNELVAGLLCTLGYLSASLYIITQGIVAQGQINSGLRAAEGDILFDTANDHWGWILIILVVIVSFAVLSFLSLISGTKTSENGDKRERSPKEKIWEALLCTFIGLSATCLLSFSYTYNQLSLTESGTIIYTQIFLFPRSAEHLQYPRESIARIEWKKKDEWERACFVNTAPSRKFELDMTLEKAQ